MKLEEAIEIKERFYIADTFNASEKYDEADRLSIEALKRIKETRIDYGVVLGMPLPGETAS